MKSISEKDKEESHKLCTSIAMEMQKHCSEIMKRYLGKESLTPSDVIGCLTGLREAGEVFILNSIMNTRKNFGTDLETLLNSVNMSLAGKLADVLEGAEGITVEELQRKGERNE